MKNATFSLALLIVFGACEISATFAQLPQTRLASLFPPGAQQGTTAEVTLTAGTDLDEVDQLIFSNPGIRAVQKVDGAGNPIASVFTVTVDPGVAPGLYDARARGLFGISNPRIFRVDTLPEMAEVEPNNAVEQATVVKLNSVVSARSDAATDVDFYRLTMEAGQTVVFRCEAARIDSAMQPELQLFNAAGRRLAQARRMFSQDASLVYTADQAGDVVLRIADIVYGGGSDFLYRLAVDSRPLVDLMVPSIVSREQATTVTLFGRYLPDGQPSDLKIDGVALQQKQFVVEPNTVSSAGVGFAAFSSPLSSVWWSGVDGNLLPVSFTAGAAVNEQEAAAAQVLTVPGDVQGSFASKGDEDEYRFQATKGETWIIEVFGHRLGGITDPLLLVERVIPGADGATETYARLGTEDDQKQNPGGNDLPTLSADPAFQLAVPEDGIYRIRVRDQYSDSRGDPRLTYRLSVRKPEPDFQLVVFDAYASADGVAPATSGAVSLRRGGSYQLMVYAYRQDGHDGAIRVEAGQLPEGISCQGAVIGPGQVSATLVLAAAENCSQLASPIQVLGRSGSDAAEQVRTARVATLVHDALNGLPRTARISDSLVVGVMKDEQPFTVVVDPVVADISQDQQLLLPVRIVRRTGFDGKVDLTFLGLPANVDAPAFFIDKGSDHTVARLFFKDNAPPSASTIVVSGLAPVPYRRNPWLAERAAQKVKDAEALVAARQQLVTEAAAAAEGAQKTVVGLNEQIAALMKEVEAYTAKKLELQTQFAAALTGYKTSIDQLGRVKDQLAAVTTTKDGTPESFDAALKAVTEATAAAEEATKNIATLTAQAEEVSGLLAMAKAMETGKAAEKAASEAKLPDLMKAVEAAQAALAAAQKMVEQTQAEKVAADEALKKAEEATKPNNLNLRTVSAPIIVNLHSAPAKVVSAALEGNAVRKGASAPVKVTLARKNGFAGPLKVTLVVPDGVVGLTSDSVDVAADQTEVILTITAAADAAVADVPHVVIRASGDFSGRAASVDIPFAIKVIE